MANKYTSVGCYPIFYVDGAHACVLCPQCVEKEEIDGRLPDDISEAVNWEDPHLYCDECSNRIESAYAEEEAS